MATTGYALATALGPVVEKTSGHGIQVDTTTPTFPWQDILGLLFERTGAINPTNAVYDAPLRQWQFAVNDEMTINYHIPHDYVPGSDIFLHVHWDHIFTTVTGGNVTFGWNVTYAKGHNQAAFSALINPTLVANASTTQRQHMISEIQLSAAAPSGTQLNSALIEPDGMILTRFYLAANNITVSGGGVPAPFIHQVDVHYQSTNIGTKNKVPNFYA